MITSQSELKVKKGKLLEARENSWDQAVIGLWRKKAKLKQSYITFDTVNWKLI